MQYEMYRLFNRKSFLSNLGLGWIRGAQDHTFTAKFNESGKATTSAILVKSLLQCLQGKITNAVYNPQDTTYKLVSTIASSSKEGQYHRCWLQNLGNSTTVAIPRGGPSRLTYHLGIMHVLDALSAVLDWVYITESGISTIQNTQAMNFLNAYRKLLFSYEIHGLSREITEDLLRCADELYYISKCGVDAVSNAQRLTEVSNNTHHPETNGANYYLPTSALSDSEVLDEFLSGDLEITSGGVETPIEVMTTVERKFVGWQIEQTINAINNSMHVLLGGPTATGKTVMVEEAALECKVRLIEIEGREGLIDLDFNGAIIPVGQERKWVDGPLTRAFRLAQDEKVVLFIDELNRIPARQINVLTGTLNPKKEDVIKAMGHEVDPGTYYTMEIPMTAEFLVCPVENLIVIGAGNFGRAYHVDPIDPAVRRRFQLFLEFDYLPKQKEVQLISDRHGLNLMIADALATVAKETRRLFRQGEMPGCIDTASLLNWASLVQSMTYDTLGEVMLAGYMTWADQVCGQNHLGQIEIGNFKAMVDYLKTLGLLVNDTSALNSIIGE